MPDSMEIFESWPRRRVAQAVEAGGVPAALLTELQPAFKLGSRLPFCGQLVTRTEAVKN